MRRTVLYTMAMVMLFAVSTVHAQESENIIPQGQFSAENAGKFPKGWEVEQDWMKSKIRVAEEGERVAAVLKGSPAVMFAKITAPEGVSQLDLSFDAEVTSFAAGKSQWDVPAVGVTFLDAEGNKVGKPVTQWFREDAEWKTITKKVSVPEGTVTIQVRAQLKAAKEGETTLKVANITLAPAAAE